MLVRVHAWFAVEYGDARFGVTSWHVGREVAVQELVVKGPAIWDGEGRLRVHGEDHERADPIKGWLGLENGGVSVSPVD